MAAGSGRVKRGVEGLGIPELHRIAFRLIIGVLSETESEEDMRIFTIAAASLIAVAAGSAVQAQGMNDLGSSAMRAELGSEIDQSMSSMLESARRSLIAETGPIVNLPYICPHAMRAMAAIAAGRVDRAQGARMFIAGLEQDKAEMMAMKIGAAPAIDFTGTKARLSVAMDAKVSREDLAGILEMGQSYLK